MPVLMLILAVGVFGYLWWQWRTTTLTRLCRWRLDRSVGPGHHVCAACGAACDLPPGKAPRDCLRPPDEPSQQ
jgi:hypothetical protein